MPLRDHFRPPLDLKHDGGGLYGMWPPLLVRHLFDRLPSGYRAAPWLRSAGSEFESRAAEVRWAADSPSAPTATVEPLTFDTDEFEVRITGMDDRRLRAVVAFVSPGNKSHTANRRRFAARSAGMLAARVSVTVVDVVTAPAGGVYEELLAAVGATAPPVPDGLYVATFRGRDWKPRRPLLDIWHQPLRVGEPLPTLPLWLSDDLAVPLELGASYEETCKYLRVG